MNDAHVDSLAADAENPERSDCSCCAPHPPSDARAGTPPTTLPLSPITPTSRAVQAVDDDCCGPRPVDRDAPDFDPLAPLERTPWWRDRVLLLPAIAGSLIVISLVAGWLEADRWLVVGLEVAALAAGASTFVPGALKRLLRRRLGVGLLMTIAAIGAVALGRVGEAAALAFLFSLAEAFETRAMDKAQSGLRALLELLPDSARRQRLDGTSENVPTAELRVGDLLIVGAGDRVSTDGVVETGSSSLDTSAITGESIPVEVGPGTEVRAGSVNGSGSMRVRATADGTDNSLTEVVRLVEEAQAHRGERARLADRIARPLVPAVLLLAGAVALLGTLLSDDPGMWIERALVVLVAASPCAMAIAVPVTVISAIGAASKLGVVIKSGEAFEQLGTIRTVALDKTGTLTRNRPQVVDVATTDMVDRDEVVRWAAALEMTSTHPLAAAVVAASTNSTRPPADDVIEHAGHGLTGVVAGRSVRVGSPRWVDPGPLTATASEMAERGMSLVVVEVDGTTVGVLGVRDELRPEAADMVAMLHGRDIRTLLLTGDDRRTAQAIAAEAGIDDVRAEMLPADKATAINRERANLPTAMIGDGINDAPALATATVGIAMGVTGSAAAIESADVAFTGHDLRLVPVALDHARRGRRIMTMNIALALAIIVVLVPLALFGVLGLAAVVVVHEAAEVVVILNGARAARTGRPAGLDAVQLS